MRAGRCRVRKLDAATTNATRQPLKPLAILIVMVDCGFFFLFVGPEKLARNQTKATNCYPQHRFVMLLLASLTRTPS